MPQQQAFELSKWQTDMVLATSGTSATDECMPRHLGPRHRPSLSVAKPPPPRAARHNPEKMHVRRPEKSRLCRFFVTEFRFFTSNFSLQDTSTSASQKVLSDREPPIFFTAKNFTTDSQLFIPKKQPLQRYNQSTVRQKLPNQSKNVKR
jgi:hypothetical protein